MACSQNTISAERPPRHDRILKNIAGQRVTIHCTVTGQMMKRPGYLAEFLEFWTPRPEIKKVWFSLFTPQIGDQLPEILTAEERARAITEMTQLRRIYQKLDAPDAVIRQSGFAAPKPRGSVSLRLRLRRCQQISRQKLRLASSEAIQTVRRADASPQWAWLPLPRTNWEALLPVGSIFKASLRIGQRTENFRAKHAVAAPK